MHLLSVMMKVETLSKFLLFGTLATGEFIPARKIEQSLNPRDNSVGGWALSAISCPVGTTSCPIKDDNAPSCCPNEYNCQYDTTGVGKHYCCPGTTNCETTIQSLPLCANTSWELYAQDPSDVGIAFFCCLPGQQGILGASAGYDIFGTCGDGSISYPSSMKATLVAEPTAKATASGASSPASEATNPQSGSPTSATYGEQSSQSSTSTPSTAGLTSPSSSNTSSSNLSTGAIVGIVIGAVGLIAIIGIVGCVCFRYGQRRGQGRQTEPEALVKSPVFHTAPATVSAAEDMKRHSPVAPAEMEYNRPIREVEGQGRVEMG